MTFSKPFKIARWNHVHGLFLALLLFPFGGAFGAPPSPKPAASVETQWPGVTVTVHQIARLPGNRVSVVFIYRASNNSPNAYLAGALLRKFDDGHQEYAAYSIQDQGELVDEATGQTFSSSEAKAGDAVHPGQTSVRELIGPNEGIFLGGIFKCPPVNQDTPPKDQQVSFRHPDLKNPIKGIRLPREENVPLDFFPKPRLHPPPVAP